MTDPISDMLTRIRNAILAGKSEVSIPHSKLKFAIASILKDNGYISGFTINKDTLPNKLEVSLIADNNRKAISSLVRISKPGRRVYAACDEIPTVLGGRGIVIVSTPGGVMTGRDARKKGLGGELICKVY